jgi:hypothetical protein
VTLPWDDLADAYARLTQAERGGGADDIALSRANLLRAREHCGALGGLLFLMMLEHGSDAVRRRLAGLVSELTDPFCDAAQKASRLSVRAWDELDVLRQRVRELEEAVARLTPGIGEPPVVLKVFG